MSEFKYTCPGCLKVLDSWEELNTHRATIHGRYADGTLVVPVKRVSLHTTPEARQTDLERATQELDEVRTALEQQSKDMSSLRAENTRLQAAHIELRAAYDQRGKAIEAATTAANRFHKALWGAVQALGEGEILEAERVMKTALEGGS